MDKWRAHMLFSVHCSQKIVLRSSYFSLYLNRKYHPPSRTASFNCLIWTAKCTLSTYCTLPSCSYWWRGAVVSRVSRMNKVNARRARLVFGWVTVFGRVYHLGTYVTNQLGQLSLASSTSFGWGKGGNVTSVGWQVTLRDPVWHVSSCSRVAG